MTKEQLTQVMAGTASASGLPPDDVAAALAGVILGFHAMTPFGEKGKRLLRAAVIAVCVP